MDHPPGLAFVSPQHLYTSRIPHFNDTPAVSLFFCARGRYPEFSARAPPTLKLSRSRSRFGSCSCIPCFHLHRW